MVIEKLGCNENVIAILKKADGKKKVITNKLNRWQKLYHTLMQEVKDR